MIATPLLVIFVIIITAILFGSWVVVSVASFIGRVIRGAFSNGEQMMPHSDGGLGGRACLNPGCRAGNPQHARFCRRCGSNLNEPIFSPRSAKAGPRFNPSNGHERQFART